jgi:outer membrane murein-binding lipoprotein Lpp
MKLKWIAIVALVVVVVVGGIGFGAYAVGKHAGEAQALNARVRILQERGGATANGQGTTGRTRGVISGNFVSGQVIQVSGDIIELNTATDLLKVKVDNQTQFQQTIPGSLSDIQPGERITIQGDRAADGSYAARFVQIGGAQLGGTSGN